VKGLADALGLYSGASGARSATERGTKP
jgi:hypothetical protein